MKRLMPVILLAFIALTAVMTIIPGCDELVTQENSYYDTTIIRDSTCVAVCHSDVNTTMAVAVRQWENSRHASGILTDTSISGIEILFTKSCGPQCHNSQGFVQSLSSQPGSTEYPLEIGCFTCHAPHTTWKLDSLRYYDPVTLADATTSFNRGKSNICALCHQAITTPTAEIDDNFVNPDDSILVYPLWGPHGSQQADMLLGTGGYEYGATIGNSSHTNASGSSCLKCHQDITEGFTLGGHSLNMRDGNDQLVAACNVFGCHSADNITDFSLYSGNDNLIYFQDSLILLADTLNGFGILNTISYIKDPGLAGALYNYLFITQDRSNGIHNLQYALGLIRESLTYIDTATSLNPTP
ncbi:MAG: hypothetical protein JSV44_08225 [Candidatus Zixiibacteriota bacterium]|nr:MAG: hypothetical protein JSV44_08225 [candidate division Zixibacteria bacterium]